MNAYPSLRNGMAQILCGMGEILRWILWSFVALIRLGWKYRDRVMNAALTTVAAALLIAALNLFAAMWRF